MTFSCNHCQTRYHIADEKVRGKILQVRCRSCQNLVEVKDPELASTSRPTSATSMTLLGIAAIPREAEAFAKPANTPATSLPKPSSPPPIAPKTTSPLPNYAARPVAPVPTPLQPNRPPAPKQAVPPNPPQPLVPPKSPAPAARPSTPMPSYATRPAVSNSAPIQPTKPPAPIKPVSSQSAPMYIPSVVAALQNTPGSQPSKSSNGAGPVSIALPLQPLMPPTEPKHWYFNRKGERNGPLRFSELTALIMESAVRPEDYAWSPEIVTWKQIKDVPLFSVYLPKEPPPFEETPNLAPVSAELSALATAPVALPPALTPVAVAPEAPKVSPPIPVALPASLPTPLAAAKPTVPVVLAVTKATAKPPAVTKAAAKPPVVVKSTIGAQSGVQPDGPTASPSATMLQASMTQKSGPTPTTKDIFANESFGAIPDAVSFRGPPQGEMSALIPISAIKPPIQRRLLLPVLLSVAFIAVAALAYTFGQGLSPNSLGTQTKDNPEDNPEDHRITPVISDKDIANLGGNNPIDSVPDPLNPTKTPKITKIKPANSDEPSTPGTPIEEPETPMVAIKDPLAEAKAAAELEKNKDLFGKKTSVSPTLTPDLGSNTTPPPSNATGSEKIAMEIISNYSGRSQNCINRSLTNGEFRKETRLNVAINSDKEGKVTSVSVGNTPANSTIETCLKGVYSGLNFKKAGGAVSLKFPIIVTPSF
jgi:predicted Zn finger-like uncharacterized protein